MVGATRFERATSSTPWKRATKLRHAPILITVYRKRDGLVYTCIVVPGMNLLIGSVKLIIYVPLWLSSSEEIQFRVDILFLSLLKILMIKNQLSTIQE